MWDAHLVFKVDCTSQLRDYVTTCRVELIAGHTAHFSVQRRFADFVWLRRRLRELYPGAILPALPSPKAAEGPESITVDLEGELARRVVARLKTFLERLCDHPLVYNSPTLLCFFTEGNGEAFRAARSAGGSAGKPAIGGFGASRGGARSSTESPASQHPPSLVVLPSSSSSSSSSWFGWGSSRTVESVLKDEDPQYLQIVEYTKKIEDEAVNIRRAAKLLVAQLRHRVNSTQLWELGVAARAAGECENTWGRPIARRSKCVELGLTLSAMGDCAERLTGADAHELRAAELVRQLKPHFKDFLRAVGGVRETFQDRAEALLEYEILSDAYDAVISAKGRSVATTDPECLAAEARREEAKATYDAIVNRMRDELPRFHAEYGAGLVLAMQRFAAAQAELARAEAESWEMMLRAGGGGGGDGGDEGDERDGGDGVGSPSENGVGSPNGAGPGYTPAKSGTSQSGTSQSRTPSESHHPSESVGVRGGGGGAERSERRGRAHIPSGGDGVVGRRGWRRDAQGAHRARARKTRTGQETRGSRETTTGEGGETRGEGTETREPKGSGSRIREEGRDARRGCGV